MYRKSVACAALLALFTWTSTTSGDTLNDEANTLLQIRQYYLTLEKNWPAIPQRVRLSFAVAEDPEYFELPVQVSVVARTVGSFLRRSDSSLFSRNFLPYLLGAELSHDEILDFYLNEVFLGRTCFGVTDAAVTYFGKSLEELRLEEIAYLAGLPRSPVRMHPVRYHDRAIQRRNQVLSRMRAAEIITKEELDAALQTDLVVLEPLGRCEIDE